MREGTLKQLNVKEGDKVRNLHSSSEYEIRRDSEGKLRCYCLKSKNLGADWWGLAVEDSYDMYELLEEEVMEIKAGDEVLYQDGLDTILCKVLAEGTYWAVINYQGGRPWVVNKEEVRKPKPKPVVKEVVMYGLEDIYWSFDSLKGNAGKAWNSHKITFNLVDGEPDCNSIKMVKL